MRKSNKKKLNADSWLNKNLEPLVDKFAGGYVVIVDNEGVVFSDADGTPAEIVKKAKSKFPGTPPLFFRVPHTQDFVCALALP